VKSSKRVIYYLGLLLTKDKKILMAQATQDDIHALTNAVVALTGAFGGANWVNVQNAMTKLSNTVMANNNALQNRENQGAQCPTFYRGNQDSRPNFLVERIQFNQCC